MCATASGVSYGTSLTQLQKNGKRNPKKSRRENEKRCTKHFQWTMKMRCDCTHLATQSRSKQRQNKNVICKKKNKRKTRYFKEESLFYFRGVLTWKKYISETFFLHRNCVYCAFFFFFLFILLTEYLSKIFATFAPGLVCLLHGRALKINMKNWLRTFSFPTCEWADCLNIFPNLFFFCFILICMHGYHCNKFWDQKIYYDHCISVYFKTIHFGYLH